jgi:hypothetical protein
MEMCPGALEHLVLLENFVARTRDRYRRESKVSFRFGSFSFLERDFLTNSERGSRVVRVSLREIFLARRAFRKRSLMSSCADSLSRQRESRLVLVLVGNAHRYVRLSCFFSNAVLFGLELATLAIFWQRFFQFEVFQKKTVIS